MTQEIKGVFTMSGLPGSQLQMMLMFRLQV